MRIIYVIVGAIAVLILALVWFVVQSLTEGDDRPVAEAPAELPPGAGTAVDSLARIQIAELEEQVLRLEEHVAALGEELLALRVELQREIMAARPPTPDAALPYEPDGPLPDSIGPGIEDYATVVLIPDRRNLNTGLTVASPSFMEEFLGRPREHLSDRCESMTNPKLQGMLRLEEVGPIRVRMLEPAIESLRRVFERVRAMDPDLYNRIDTAGSLCVRQIRGSLGRISNHAFGLAVDINIDGQLDVLGDGRTQLGLLLMSDLFREEGWIWGAAFSREDSMHFEVSREKLEQWREEGRI